MVKNSNSLRARTRSHLFFTTLKSSDCSQWPTREVRVRCSLTRDSWFRCSKRTEGRSIIITAVTAAVQKATGRKPTWTDGRKERGKEQRVHNLTEYQPTRLVCKCLKEMDTTKSILYDREQRICASKACQRTQNRF